MQLAGMTAGELSRARRGARVDVAGGQGQRGEGGRATSVGGGRQGGLQQAARDGGGGEVGGGQPDEGAEKEHPPSRSGTPLPLHSHSMATPSLSSLR